MCRLWCGTRMAIVYYTRRTGASTSICYDWALARGGWSRESAKARWLATYVIF